MSAFMRQLLAVITAIFTNAVDWQQVFQDFLDTFGGVDGVRAEYARQTEMDYKAAAKEWEASHQDVLNPDLKMAVAGKIFPGDGSFLKILMELFMQFLPYIKTPPAPAKKSKKDVD